MALRGKCDKIFGVDTDHEAIAFAEKHGIVDQATMNPKEVLSKSNVIVLAAPVEVILQFIHNLPALHSGEAIVLDLGSTKREIVAAFDDLPDCFDPIGGHPMCGKEKLTIFNADAMLFHDAPFAFTPLERTTKMARDFATQLAEAIGAHPLWIAAATHDAWTAATSHLPYLISLLLALSTPSEAKPLVGTGFKSTTRLAGTPGSIMFDILRTNRDEILNAISRFSEQLKEITQFIETMDFDSMAEIMEQGRTNREMLVGMEKQ
jgi:prephenate dehydrogenase